MSLAVLKRKTKTLYHSMSVGRPQFSLNGFYRNDRSSIISNRIQTSIPRTLAKGNALKGYGGCCGTFTIKTISPLCEQPQAEQPETRMVKPSSMSTNGMIATKYRWIKMPNPNTWVKRDNNSALYKSSNSYTERLTREATATIISTDNRRSSTLNQCNYIKNDYTAYTQGKYIAKLGGECVNTVVNTVFELPTNLCGEPILGN